MTDVEERPQVPLRHVLLSRDLAWGSLVLGAGQFSLVGLSANAPLIRMEFGLSRSGVGAMASFAYVGAMLTARLAGKLTDEHGPIPVVMAGLGLIGLGAIVAAVSPGAVVLYAAALIGGFGYGAINPATTVLVNTRTTRRRGLVMSLKQSGVPAGGMLGSSLLPVFAAHVGWRNSLLLAVAVAVTVAAAVWRRRASSEQDARLPKPTPPERTTLDLPRGYVYGLLMAGVQVAIFALLTVYLVEERGLSPAWAGLGLSLLFLGGLLGRPVWGVVADRLEHDRVAVLAALSATASVTLLGLTLVPRALLPVVLLAMGLFSVGWNGVFVAAVAEATKPEDVGSSAGSSLVLINLGAVLFPFLIGSLVESSGSWPLGWASCAAMSAVAATLAVMSRTPAGTSQATAQ